MENVTYILWWGHRSRNWSKVMEKIIRDANGLMQSKRVFVGLRYLNVHGAINASKSEVCL